MRESLFQGSSLFFPAIGEVPSEASSAQPLHVWLRWFEGGRVGFNVITDLDPGYRQRGPYEASEGIHPRRRHGKTGGGQVKMAH